MPSTLTTPSSDDSSLKNLSSISPPTGKRLTPNPATSTEKTYAKKRTTANGSRASDVAPSSPIAFECTDARVTHFDRLAARASTRPVRDYYARQADLLRSVRDDRLFVKRFANLGVQQPPADAFFVATEETAALSRWRTRVMIIASLCVNVTLTGVKCAASLLSGSLAIVSSLVDSALDLVSGLVTWYTVREIRKRDPYLYPRGCTRMEPLGSVIVSVIMGVANLQVISKAVEAIIADSTHIDVRMPTILMMLFTILCKFILYILCKLVNSSAIAVLTLDHRNDCVSNTVAIVCAYLAYYYHDLRFMDPLGAVVVSSYICVTWFISGRQHMQVLSGRAAKPEFYCRILHVALDHLPQHVQEIETLKVYHMGTQFLVELHIVLDRDMPVHQAHDISELLQRKIEHLPYVERAFVHVDHDTTHSPEQEHKDV